MQIIELLPVDEQIQHVVSLTANLQTNLDPIQLGALEEFGGLQTLEQILFILAGCWAGVELIEDPCLEHLLIRYPNLGRVVEIARHALPVPMCDERHVDDTPRPARSQVERAGSMVQRNTSRCVGGGERTLGQQRLERCWIPIHQSG